MLRAAGALALRSESLNADPLGAPALVRSERSRPLLAQGTASGDVAGGRGIVWSRTDRPARMRVEWSTTESFSNARSVAGPAATLDSGFTARVDLTSLPPGQRIFYRVRFEDLSDSRNLSLPSIGSFLSAPAAARDLMFAWSADTCGQGWGIDVDRGGLPIYESIRRARPDFFVHCGDTIYADDPLPPEKALPDGTTWRNVVTPAKSKVAETLDEFRGNHLYNLLDENVRRFNAEVPQVVLWDDHEVMNNWDPFKTTEGDPRYGVRSVAELAGRARQAFLEHVPIRLSTDARPRIFRSLRHGPLLEVMVLDLRSYRGANSGNRQPERGPESDIAGAAQIRWLEHALAASTATWKVIVSGVPIGLVVCDGEAYEGVSNGDGPALGRELEIARLLRFIRSNRIRNIVWLTADVHYAAAHHYDPARARFESFDPFWEFVAGPLHAGVGVRLPLDDTFGPEVRFAAVPEGMPYGIGPASGLQFYGTVQIAAATGAMTVRLHDITGHTIHTTDLEPRR